MEAITARAENGINNETSCFRTDPQAILMMRSYAVDNYVRPGRLSSFTLALAADQLLCSSNADRHRQSTSLQRRIAQAQAEAKRAGKVPRMLLRCASDLRIVFRYTERGSRTRRLLLRNDEEHGMLIALTVCSSIIMAHGGGLA